MRRRLKFPDNLAGATTPQAAPYCQRVLLVHRLHRGGALKANIGHTDVAAGIAGLVKAALSLFHRTLPPLANWRRAGPDSPLAIGPLLAPSEARSLDPRHGVIRAGVSAFGVGGTNAHAVLEAAPDRALPVGDDRPQLLVWSARGDAVRTRLTGLLSAHVATAGAIADVAWSLQTGRTSLPDRAALAVRNANDALAGLSAPKRIRDQVPYRPQTQWRNALGCIANRI
jgi:acyl transferase domain-containing protein